METAPKAAYEFQIDLSRLDEEEHLRALGAAMEDCGIRRIVCDEDGKVTDVLTRNSKPGPCEERNPS